jgi:hypothetical protein
MLAATPKYAVALLKIPLSMTKLAMRVPIEEITQLKTGPLTAVTARA